MRALRRASAEIVAVMVAAVVFLVPFSFIVLIAVKDQQQAAELGLSWPTRWAIVENLKEVISTRDHMVLFAFLNSMILTVVSVGLLVVLCAMTGFVLQRRRGHATTVANLLMLAGLIIPPAIVPTIWVLQTIGLFKTLPGLILVEVAFSASYATLLFRAFVATIPRQLDEAAVMDGCSAFWLFFRVVFPLLRPVAITVALTTSVVIFNDFANPLYFLPGSEFPTVQLTLFNFQGQYHTQWNLLFTNILLITIPPFLAFIFFNRKIVAGMTAGAIKG